ncbi:MAG TPA: hypothetical protein VIX18_01970 [Nitrospirota bacterium]
MRTMPQECRDINTVEGFCACIAGAETADAAARAFCIESRSGSERMKSTGDDLAELKKALMDLEDE